MWSFVETSFGDMSFIYAASFTWVVTGLGNEFGRITQNCIAGCSWTLAKLRGFILADLHRVPLPNLSFRS